MTTEAGPGVLAKNSPCLNATMACERMLCGPCANFTSCQWPVPASSPPRWSHVLPAMGSVTGARHTSCVCTRQYALLPWSPGQRTEHCPVHFPWRCQGLRVLPGSLLPTLNVLDGHRHTEGTHFQKSCFYCLFPILALSFRLSLSVCQFILPKCLLLFCCFGVITSLTDNAMI